MARNFQYKDRHKHHTIIDCCPKFFISDLFLFKNKK